MCNEIFGEENFVATVIWQKVFSPKNTAAYFSEDHDYVLAYAKNKNEWLPELLPRSKEATARYKNLDDDPRGNWSSSDLTARNFYSDGQYEVTGPTGKKFKPAKGSYWRHSHQNFLELDRDNRVWWGKSGENMPRLKRFLTDVKDGVVPQTLLLHTLVGNTQEAKKELLEFVEFEETQNVLNSVKPTRLLKHLLKIGTKPSENHLVMDFFAGSAPLAHACISQNAEDGGNRKFIVVQLPQKLKVDEPEMKTIADMGRARVRNYGTKLSKEYEDSVINAGDGTERPDIGFKSLALDKSNFTLWQKVEADAEEGEISRQLELAVDHIDPSASQEDLLFELLLKAGFELSVDIESSKIAKSNVFAIEEGALLICLEDEITQELLDEVVKLEPIQFICLDKAFQGNDQLKANAVQTFSAHNHGRDKADQIIFRTV